MNGNGNVQPLEPREAPNGKPLRSLAFRLSHPGRTTLAAILAEAATNRLDVRFDGGRPQNVLPLSLGRKTAVRMLLSHTKNPDTLFPLAMVAMFVALEHTLDLGDATVRDAWGVTERDICTPNLERCRDLAARARLAGIQAIRAPSTVDDGDTLTVFCEHLHDPGSIGVHGTELLNELPLV